MAKAKRNFRVKRTPIRGGGRIKEPTVLSGALVGEAMRDKRSSQRQASDTRPQPVIILAPEDPGFKGDTKIPVTSHQVAEAIEKVSGEKIDLSRMNMGWREAIRQYGELDVTIGDRSVFTVGVYRDEMHALRRLVDGKRRIAEERVRQALSQALDLRPPPQPQISPALSQRELQDKFDVLPIVILARANPISSNHLNAISEPEIARAITKALDDEDKRLLGLQQIDEHSINTGWVYEFGLRAISAYFQPALGDGRFQFQVGVFPDEDRARRQLVHREGFGEARFEQALANALDLRPKPAVDPKPAAAEVSEREAQIRTLENKVLVVISPEHPEFPGDMQRAVSLRHMAEAASQVLSQNPLGMPTTVVSPEEVYPERALEPRYGVREAYIGIVPVKIGIFRDIEEARRALLANQYTSEQAQEALVRAAHVFDRLPLRLTIK